MPITVVVPRLELFDDENEVFVYQDEITIVLEHSLISLSRWESKWHKFFLGPGEKTDEETLTYIQCMGIGEEISREVIDRLINDPSTLTKIFEYIQDPLTATTFSTIDSGKPSREMISSELIYYWMHTMGIDKSCEDWPLARLITLIRLTSEKNKPAKKANKADTLQRYRSINEQNKKLFETKKEGR